MRGVTAMGMIVLALAGVSAAQPLGERIASAAPGATIRVVGGTHAGHLRIDKPLTLIGVDRPVIDGGGNGDIIEITAPDVRIEGFVLRNTGIDLDKENCAVRVLAPRAVIEGNEIEDILFGIDLRSAPGAVIRNNRIGGKQLDIARRGDGVRLWRSDGVLIEGNEIHDGRDTILWYSKDITVRNNTAHRCRYGMHLMYSDHVELVSNELRENSVGAYFMYSKDLVLHGNRLIRNRGPSGYGLGLKEADRYTVTDNLIAGNRVGVYIDGSPFTHEQPGLFTHNAFSCNDVGVTFLPSVRGNRLTENSFVDNVEQISVQGRGDLGGNEFAYAGKGNYWSDYVGYDLDRDGVGDDEHVSERLFENLLDREPSLRILLYSPAQQAIEFVARALPAIRPEPKFTDPMPLMSQPACAGVMGGAGTADSGGKPLALGMVGAGLAVWGAALYRPRRREVVGYLECTS